MITQSSPFRYLGCVRRGALPIEGLETEHLMSELDSPTEIL